MDTGEYDPFASGACPVGVRTFQAFDRARSRLFPCEIWYPARRWDDDGPVARPDAVAHPGQYPLIVFSHHSGGHRRAATFLCTHLASHGYVVAALDHSEVVAAELSRREGETDEARAARIDAVIASRVPDVRFLLDVLLNGVDGAVADAANGGIAGLELDATRIGLIGHSFGGWTALATPEVESRIAAVIALAPGGSSHRRPGILPLDLTFAWSRSVPALYLAAEDDAPVPLVDVYDVYDRTPEPKRLIILRRADHQHFLDDVEEVHEAVRAAEFPGEVRWILDAMRPITELCSGEQAHLFVRGLALAHLDATLRRNDAAERFLAGDVEAELAVRGVEAIRPTAATDPVSGVTAAADT